MIFKLYVYESREREVLNWNSLIKNATKNKKLKVKIGFNFFSIFIANKIFEIFFTKRDLIRYYYFVNIYIVHQNRSFMLVKIAFFNFSSINFYNFLSIFIYGFQKNYNFSNLWFSFFSFKSVFWIKFLIFFYLFLNMLSKMFIIFHFFLFKSSFWSKFIASKLLSQKSSWYLALIYFSLKELSKSSLFEIIGSNNYDKGFFLILQYFFLFSTSFFCHLLVDFCIVHGNTVTFFLYLL